MIGSILAVAGAEIRIGFRNRWVILASLILLAFALVLGFVGSAPTGTVKADPLPITVASLASLSVYLVPLIALLLSFDAIAGEADRGTLPLVLATPISRSEFLFGKFLGHLVIIGTAVVTGYGIAGAIVLAAAGGGTAGLSDLTRLIATSIALGGVFLGIGYVASASVRQTGSAAALAVGIWLFSVILYDLGLLGALIADGDGVFARTIFPYLLAANPADAFRLYNIASLEGGNVATGFSGTAGSLPFPYQTALISLAAWLVMALGLSHLIFRRLEP